MKNKNAKNNKKMIFTDTVLLLFLLGIPGLALAQSPGAADAALTGTQAILVPVINFLQGILWPVLLMIGSLLQNDLLFSPGMEDKLLLVWGNIRNIVNILFVFILLGIAFFNIVGGGENYGIKKELPKFIIALIAVNFTYIGAKVMLDGVNVVSTALFALPSSVGAGLKPPPATSTGVPAAKPEPETKGPLTHEQLKTICSHMVGAPVGSIKYNEMVVIKEHKAIGMCTTAKKEENGLTEKAKNFFSKFGAQNAGLILAIAMGKTNLLDQVTVSKSTIGQLIQNSLFSIIFYVIYATSFVALFVTLLVRMIVLWIMIVLSPLIVLKYVLPQNIMGGLGEVGDIQKKFVKHAMIPIPIALVLSIGFIMLEALGKIDFNKAGKNLNLLTMKTVNFDLLTSGISTLQEFIIAIGMIGFIWIGVFAVLKDTYADKAIHAIKGAVGGVGKFVGSLPFMAPIIPIGEGKAVSLGALGYGLKQAENIPAESYRTGANRDLKGLMGGITPELVEKFSNIKNRSQLKAHEENVYQMAADPEIQKARARTLQNLTRDFDDIWGRMRDKGNTDKQQFLDALKAGNADEKLIKSYQEALQVTPKPLPGTAGAAGTAGVAAAAASVSAGLLDDNEKTVVKEKAKLQGLLSKPERDALDKLDTAITGEKEAEIKAAKDSNDAQSALKKGEVILNTNIRIQSNINELPAKIDAQSAKDLNNKLADEVKVLVKPVANGGAGFAEKKAKDEVIRLVSTQLSDVQRKQIVDLKEGGILGNAAAVKRPPTK